MEIKDKLKLGSLVPIHHRVVGDKKVGVLNKDLLKAVMPLLREIVEEFEMSRAHVSETFPDYLEELLEEKKG